MSIQQWSKPFVVDRLRMEASSGLFQPSVYTKRLISWTNNCSRNQSVIVVVLLFLDILASLPGITLLAMNETVSSLALVMTIHYTRDVTFVEIRERL